MAPKYAGLDKVNPGSVILSGEMMLRYMGWNEAADRIVFIRDGSIVDETQPAPGPESLLDTGSPR